MKLRPALIKLYSVLFGAHPKLVGDAAFVRTQYLLAHGKRPDLTHPMEFNEQICKIKLSDDSTALSAYTDKYEVRRYVSGTVGERYLTPVFGVYDRFSDIPFSSLPDRFALKATHASGWNLIVPDKSKLNIPAAEKQLNKWLSKNYYLVGREKNYKEVPPRILAEEYIDYSDSRAEYKFFCFHGEVRMIAVHRNLTRHYATCFTPEWEGIPVEIGYPAEENIPRPAALDGMLSCARKLSAPFDFVRVDLSADGESIRFSELTFTPGGGLVHITPQSFSKTMESWFEQK